METVYLFSSPGRDVPVDGKILQRAFQVEPLRDHPFMTLEDYFSAVRDFVLMERGGTLVRILTGLWGSDTTPGDIERVLIRYEKYGTLYQIASVEVLSGNRRAKFAVSTALSPEAKSTLLREFELLKRLRGQWDPSFVPRIFFKGTVSVDRGPEEETLLMVLSGWLEGYHEWHFAADEEAPEHVIVWDTDRGYRTLAGRETREVVRLASKILTLYYDTRTFLHIFPWHHGAGDFVLRQDERGIDVRLVTARGYEPLLFPERGTDPEPLRAALCFLLLLSVKMRLDKREGMGGPTWAHASLLGAVLEGFFEALRTREAKGAMETFGTTDLLRLAKGLEEGALGRLLQAQMDLYRHRDPADIAAVRDRLDQHARDLHRALQAFRDE
ncbi:MAG: hypothetical protein JW821_19445 [Deltaproteobacteria bacterium]|nr:hypothetical protein [Deltaproteobacteria bacterium]